MIYIEKHFEEEINFESLNQLFGKSSLKFFILLRMVNKKNMKIGEDKFSLIIGDKKENNSLIISSKPLLKENLSKTDLTYFLNEKGYNAKIYIDFKNHITNIVYQGDLSILKDYILALLPRLLPWHFGITPKEILEHCSDLLKAKYDYIYDQYNLQLKKSGLWDDMMYAKIQIIYDFIKEKEKNDIKDKINLTEDMIDEYLQLIARYTKELKEFKNRLSVFNLSSREDKNEIKSFIEHLKTLKDNIKIININNTKIVLRINAKMTNFEFDEYELYIKNGDHRSQWLSSHYIPYNISINEQQLKMLYKHIFETKKLSVNFLVDFILDIADGTVIGNPSPSEGNGIPHPHLMGNGRLCLGGNSVLISQYIMRGDLQGTINQLLYSAKQISLSDLMAVENFIKSIFTDNGIELPTGEFVNGMKAIEYIEQHQEEFDD